MRNKKIFSIEIIKSWHLSKESAINGCNQIAYDTTYLYEKEAEKIKLKELLNENGKILSSFKAKDDNDEKIEIWGYSLISGLKRTSLTLKVINLK